MLGTCRNSNGRHRALHCCEIQLTARLIAKLNKLESQPTLCFRKAKKEFEAIRLRYILCTSHLHLQAATEEKGCQINQEEFHQIIASENSLGEHDLLVRRVQIELGLSDHHQLEGATLFEQYTRHGIDCVAKTVKHSIATVKGKYNICLDCCIEMSVNADTSELTCAKCGKV